MLFPTTALLRITLSRSCLLLAVCWFAPHVAFAQSAGDEAAVRVLVERFFDLYQKRDLDGLMGLWSEKSPDFATSKQRFQQIFAANKIEVKSVTIHKVTVGTDTATVSARAEVFAEDVKTGKAADGFGILNRTFHLLKEGEVWKVWQCAVPEQGFAAALVAAKTEEERRALLAKDKGLITAELVRALLSEGRRLVTRGENSAALNSYGIALSLAEQLNIPMAASDALGGLGVVYGLQGNYRPAVERFESSLKICAEIGDKLGTANALNNIGNVLRRQGNYAQALEQYQKSLSIKEELGDKRGAANSFINIGIVNYLRGNYAEALTHFQKSLKISEEIDYKAGVSSALNNIGNVHVSQGNYAQALEQYQRSLKISEQLANKQVIAGTLNNIGRVHASQGNYEQALEHYSKGLKVSEEIENKLEVANALGNIGDVHYLQRNYAQALGKYQNSLRISEEINDQQGISVRLNSIGNVLASQGNQAQALEQYRNSLRIKSEIGYKEGTASILTSIGNLYLSQGNNRLAREYLTNAIAAAEEARRDVVGDERQQQQFFQMLLAPYHYMVKLSVDEKKPVDAFGFAERVKGRALLDTLEKGRAPITKAMTADEESQEQRLNADVVSLNIQINRENLRNQPDKAILSDLQAQLEKARASYEAFQINLYAAHPELKIQRGQMKPISLEEASRLIPDSDTAVLEYVVTEDRTYLFVLTKEQRPRPQQGSSADIPTVSVYTIDVKQKDLAGRVERFRGRLTQKDNEFSDFARQLYDLLIGPARSYLKDQTSLIIVPDGVLWEVPFQALQSPGNRFLIQDYAISYAPSLTVLREMMNLKRKRQAAQAGSALIAFGNPDVAPKTAANLQAVYPEVLADERLLPLPQTEDMLKILSRIYGPDRSKVYVRTEAREDRAKKEAGDCRVLQFATHGILDNTNPMYSRLVMSQSGVGEHEDGMLEAWEIMRLDLKAEMAVLAACETARGRVAGGEAMIGLAWAFFVAGCPTTVVSQWRVEVNSMNRLMIDFHKRLKPGMAARGGNASKAEALRAASLNLLRNPRYRHPFYWAPFVLIGSGR